MATMSLSLGVRDLERELKFFTAIGFEASSRTETAVQLHFGDAEIEIESYETLRVADAPLLDWDKAPSEMGTGAQLYFAIADVEAFASRIPIGVARPWPVQDKEWGTRELTLRSPSGYILTFAQRRA